MNKKTLLVLGAKSDIGISIAHRFAKENFDIQLAARNSYELKNDVSDIQIRYGVNVSCYEFDAINIDKHEAFITSLPTMPLVVISAIGSLGIQNESENNFRKAMMIFRTNFEGVAIIFGLFANHFERRGSGTLIGISSVAGDRGRASNYIYGSAKAGLTAFLSGLRNRLHPKGINVITVKPGFVKTKMTANLNLPKLLTTNPKRVSDFIYEAYKSKKKIVYVPSRWRIIMTILKMIPELIFIRMKL